MRKLVIAIVLGMACSPSGRSTVLDVADPASAPQLVSGFYAVENDFRWTAPSFVAQLRPPPGAAQRGAHLVMQLWVSDALIAANHDTTLSCSIDGAALPPQRYDEKGAQKLERDTPPLVNNPATLSCSLSHPLGPTPTDSRQLGIVVSKIRLITARR